MSSAKRLHVDSTAAALPPAPTSVASTVPPPPMPPLPQPAMVIASAPAAPAAPTPTTPQAAPSGAPALDVASLSGTAEEVHHAATAATAAAAATGATGADALMGGSSRSRIEDADAVLSDMNKAAVVVPPAGPAPSSASDGAGPPTEVSKDDINTADALVHLDSLDTNPQKSCCTNHCLSKVCVEERDTVLSILASFLSSQSRRERDIFLLNCIRYVKTGPHNALSLSVPPLSTPLCRTGFCLLFALSADRFASMRQMALRGQLYPPAHGLTGRRSNSSTAAEQVDGVVEFLLRLASVRGKPADRMVHLPPTYTMHSVYDVLYRRWTAERNMTPVSQGVFMSIWNRDVRCRHVVSKRQSALRCEQCVSLEIRSRTCPASDVEAVFASWRQHISAAFHTWESECMAAEAEPALDDDEVLPTVGEWHLFHNGPLRRRPASEL